MLMFVIAPPSPTRLTLPRPPLSGLGHAHGRFLDPVADKPFVSAALVALVGLVTDAICFVALVIIGREITVSRPARVDGKVGASGAVKVNWFGKIKTIAQMTAIPMLLWWDPVVVSTSLLSGELNIAFLGRVLIIVAAVLTIYSMYVYLMAARKAHGSRVRRTLRTTPETNPEANPEIKKNAAVRGVFHVRGVQNEKAGFRRKPAFFRSPLSGAAPLLPLTQAPLTGAASDRRRRTA